MAELAFRMQNAIDLRVFEAFYRDRSLAVIESRSAALLEVASPRLVHCDFHLGNLLHVGEEISGLLDFEWAFAGDPLFDLTDWYPEVERWPGSRGPFFRGYGKTKFSESEIRRIEVYQMLSNIALRAIAKEHFSTEEAQQYRDATTAHLQPLGKPKQPPRPQLRS